MWVYKRMAMVGQLQGWSLNIPHEGQGIELVVRLVLLVLLWHRLLLWRLCYVCNRSRIVARLFWV
jgi:hypothetical protein